MNRRVLVTRPEPGAAATAARLKAMGLVPVIVPLTRILTLSPSPPAPDVRFDAVALTSANAVRHAPAELLQALSHLPAMAVGEATAAEARKAGLRVELTGDGSGTDLARTIVARLDAGARLAYPCGRIRRPEIERALDEAGIEIVLFETYDAVAIEYDHEELIERLGAEPPMAALVYSPNAGALLARLAGHPRLAGVLAGTRILAISAQAAEPLTALGRFRIEIAERPEEDSVLSLLANLKTAR